MTPEKDVLNVQEAARFLGVHIETIRRLARNSKIPAFKVGRGWRIRMDALLKWADTQPIQSHQNTILVVDDDNAVQTSMRLILERLDFHVLEASDGAGGLTLLAQNEVDAIFLDLQMPVMTGPAFLMELRRRNIDSPVTLITGYPDSELVMEASHFGPVTLLVKPMQKEQILHALKSMIGYSVNVSETD